MNSFPLILQAIRIGYSKGVMAPRIALIVALFAVGACTNRDLSWEPLGVISVSAQIEVSGGKTRLNIQGQGFYAGIRVFLSQLECSDVEVVSATQLFCTPPALAPGNVDILIKAPDAGQVELTQAFTYPRADQITLTGPSEVVAGECVAFEVQIRGTKSLPVAVVEPVLIPVNFDGVGSLFAEAECSHRATLATIAAQKGTQTVYFKSTKAQSSALRAETVGDLAGSVFALTVRPAAASTEKSSLILSRASGVIADGVDRATITVVLRDTFMNPIPHIDVGLVATGLGNDFTQPPSATDENGRTVGAIRSTRSGIKTVSFVTPSNFSGLTAAIGFVAGPIASNKSTLNLSPSPALADGSSNTVTIQVRDGLGNPVIGVSPVLEVDGSGNTISQFGPTDEEGSATATLASSVPESKKLHLSSPPELGDLSLNATFLIGKASAATSSITAPSDLVIANGIAQAAVTITLKDGAGNPVVGALPVIAVSGTENTITQPTNATNFVGVTTATFSSTKAELKTLSIVSPEGISAATSTVEFNGDTPVAQNCSIALSDSELVANGSAKATVTITLRDSRGNPSSGYRPSFTVSGSGNAITAPDLTDSRGVATGTLATFVAELKTLRLIIPSGITPATATMTFLPGPPSATRSTLSAPTTQAVADGTTVATLTFTLRDANNNLVAAGVRPEIAVSGSANTIVQPASSNASGVTTATITSTKAETKTVTVTAPPSLVGTTTTFAFKAGAASPTNSTVSASPSTGVIADGRTANLTFTLKDAFGNPVSGVTPRFVATGTDNILTQPTIATNSLGVVTGRIATTTAEEKTISLTVPSSLSSLSATVGFIAPPAPVNVDNFQTAAGSSANAIARDSLGNLYVAGSSRGADSSLNWFIRKSSNGGVSWTSLENFQLVAGQDAAAIGIGISPANVIYVTGTANDGTRDRWIVRKSTNAGASWTLVDNFLLDAAGTSRPRGIAAFGTSVYVVGESVDASGAKYWIVRRTSNNGGNWTVQETFQLSAPFAASAASVVTDSLGMIYVAGYGIDASNVSHWIVRKSSDAGLSWATINDFQLVAGSASAALGIGKDSAGAIYVVGRATPASGGDVLVVRKTLNRGVNWTSWTPYSANANVQTVGVSFGQDSSGNPFVAGYTQDISTSIRKWMLVNSLDNGVTWRAVESYQHTPDISADARAFLGDPSGARFVVGAASDPAGPRWIVRKY